jgi:hypothetical protein
VSETVQPGNLVLNPEGGASTEWRELLGAMGWWEDRRLPLSGSVGRVLRRTKYDLVYLTLLQI